MTAEVERLEAYRKAVTSTALSECDCGQSSDYQCEKHLAVMMEEQAKAALLAKFTALETEIGLGIHERDEARKEAKAKDAEIERLKEIIDASGGESCCFTFDTMKSQLEQKNAELRAAARDMVRAVEILEPIEIADSAALNRLKAAIGD